MIEKDKRLILKKYRFFLHYNKPHNAVTVHFRGKCLIAKDVACHVPTFSKFNKSQPRFVMQGFANLVKQEGDYVEIS